jgi:mRNA-degrading endonuclease toxin of MazEF toxin-antitoxin module
MTTPGSVWDIDLSGARGHEQRGSRRFIVIQDEDFSALSVVVGVPTSTSAQPSRLHVPVEVEGQETLALCEQVRAIDLGRLGRARGAISYGELLDVRRTVGQIIGLRWPSSRAETLTDAPRRIPPPIPS